MAYALFAQKKLMYQGLINTVQNQQMQRSEEQMAIATRTLNLQNRISSLQDAQTDKLKVYYDALANMGNDATDVSAGTTYDVGSDYGGSLTRSEINGKIADVEREYENEIDRLNRKITFNTNKENIIEMEVKRLDTRITALKKQLEKIEEAEGDGIDKATPKFKGIG